MISSGVALASRGELRFDVVGFVTQAAAVGVRPSLLSLSLIRNELTCGQFEAARLVMIQLLLHGLKMDPLVSLHYYAPVCAVLNLAVLPFTEGMAPLYEVVRVGWVSFSFSLLSPSSFP